MAVELAPAYASRAAEVVTSQMVLLRLYDGTTMLAELPVIAQPPRAGRVRLDASPGVAVATGVVDRFAVLDGRGAPCLAGTVGTGDDADMLTSQTGIEAGAEVTMTSFVYRQET